MKDGTVDLDKVSCPRWRVGANGIIQQYKATDGSGEAGSGESSELGVADVAHTGPDGLENGGNEGCYSDTDIEE